MVGAVSGNRKQPTALPASGRKPDPPPAPPAARYPGHERTEAFARRLLAERTEAFARRLLASIVLQHRRELQEAEDAIYSEWQAWADLAGRGLEARKIIEQLKNQTRRVA
jgi:hypothetical protein